MYERVSQICSRWLYRRDGVEVRAFGVNVNRLLFNVKGKKSHHAFIPCRALYWRCSRCVLAQFTGFTEANIKLPWCLDNGRVAIFDATSVDFDIPNFFAVEQNGYFDPIKILLSDVQTNLKEDPLVEHSGWIESTSETEAAITAHVFICDPERFTIQFFYFCFSPVCSDLDMVIVDCASCWIIEGTPRNE